MHRAEGGITRLPRGQHDAERHDIGKLLELDVAPLHLLPDRIGRLLPPRDFRDRHPLVGADSKQLGADFLDHILPLAAQEVEARQNAFESLGIKLCKSEGLQLVLDHIHADPLGERGIDLHGFAGDALALFVLHDEVQRAHVVQPIRQLDEQDTNILAHRQHQLAEILGLLVAVGLQFETGELGHAVHQGRDFRAEAAFHLGAGECGILQHIVQQGGCERRIVEAIAREGLGDREGMGYVGVAVFALLPVMRGVGDIIGRLEHGGVTVRIVAPDGLEQPFCRAVLQHDGSGGPVGPA